LRTIALITAAGKGRRMNSETPKQYLPLDGKPILVRTMEIFEACAAVDEIYVIVPADQMDRVEKEIIEKYQFRKVLKVVRGGKMRQQSVWNGLKAIRSDCSVVIVHDGVRPFVTPKLIEKGIKVALETGAAVVAVPAKDTIKRAVKGKVVETLPREEIWLAQTPQSFQYTLLMRAYQKANQEEVIGTDDASLVEQLGHPVTLIEGDYANIKITTLEDLAFAEAYWAKGLKDR
jgi:2-C-methyl-D-erythritol 4-phosphate cytidylyltransferase